jgi:type I restriction enzyme M protein
MSISLSQFIKAGSVYALKIFSPETIARIEHNIISKGEKYYIKCIKREKDLVVKPEEIVRQLMLDKLINEYHYPVDLLDVEYPVSFGREKKFADIVILNKADKTSVYCVLEIKKTNAKDGKEQLKSYTNGTGAPLAVWTNGIEIDYYERLDPNYFEPLSDIPNFNETIDDVKNEKFTYLELMIKDKLAEERKSLKEIIKEMEDEVLANAGVDVFEEVFKLIFIKLYDEMESADDRVNIEQQLKMKKKNQHSLSDKELLASIDNEDFRKLEFRSRGDAHHTKEVVNKLFKDAKTKRP